MVGPLQTGRGVARGTIAPAYRVGQQAQGPYTPFSAPPRRPRLPLTLVVCVRVSSATLRSSSRMVPFCAAITSRCCSMYSRSFWASASRSCGANGKQPAFYNGKQELLGLGGAVAGVPWPHAV